MLWLKTYKQIKGCISKKQKANLSPELLDQWKSIKSGSLRNALRALWKRKEFQEGMDLFKKYLTENDQDVKFLSLGFEFMLELALLDEFKSEVSRIKSKYAGGEFTPKNQYDKPTATNPELVAQVEVLEKNFLKKFNLAEKKVEATYRANFQKRMWKSNANSNYEKQELIRQRMAEDKL